jgi:hypothetical protein
MFDVCTTGDMAHIAAAMIRVFWARIIAAVKNIDAPM